jgi:hypothetical protein
MSSSAVSPISNPLATALPSLVVNAPDALLHGATLTTSDLPLDKGEDFVYCMTHRGTESQGDCDILAVFVSVDTVATPSISMVFVCSSSSSSSSSSTNPWHW